ncbi:MULTISPECIES: hypothetical protein [unclassified Mameliella]|nr:MULTISPECIES: hypothetical protein [unclassified Mameliella]
MQRFQGLAAKCKGQKLRLDGNGTDPVPPCPETRHSQMAPNH